MKPKISVIVPVYNVEAYVAKCLDSLISQTLDAIEIIVVDDGSSDGSGVICDKYAQSHRNIQSFHKENGGLSSARNYGIERATGEYIGFVDSDDYVDSDMFEYLLHLADDNDADVAGCDMYDCFSGQEIKRHGENLLLVLDTIDAVKCVLESRTSMNVVNKIFKKSLFENVKFTEGITLEDAFIIVDLLSQSKCSVFTNAQKYYYFHRGNSITTLPFNKHSYDALTVHDYNYKRAIELAPELESVADLRRCWARFYVLDKMMLSDGNYDHDIERDCIRFLSKRKKKILTCGMFTHGRKGAFIALLISKRLYRKIVSEFSKKKRGANA